VTHDIRVFIRSAKCSGLCPREASAAFGGFVQHILKEVFDQAGLSKMPISAQANSPGAIPGEYMVEDDRMGFYMCIDTLIRNRIIEKNVRTHFHDALNAGSGQTYETYSLTARGRTFIRACEPPPKS
jgi:hypothetical protein